MKKLDKREKILAIAVLALLLLFVSKLLVVDPLREKLDTARNEISQAELTIRKYLQVQKHKDEIIAGQKQIERYLNFKGTNEDKAAAILTKVEQLSRAAGLSILDMNPVSVPKDGGSNAIFRISLRAEGEMAKLIDFIYNLENADILFKIEKLNLAIKDENSQVLKIDSNILALSLT